MSPEPPKTAIIYCRVSTKDQVDNTSLEHQERVCREFAAHEGLVIVHKPFVDEGESAKTADRREFNNAIGYCQKQKGVGHFIVYKLDRFARNQEDHVVVRALLKRAGTTLRSATEPINDSPVGRAMEGMVSVFAEFDNNVRTERTKNGMLERVKHGIWVWPSPLGYTRHSKGSNITPDQGVAPFIQLAFEEYSKGVYTYKSLSKFLADRGFRSRHGLIPGPQQIEKILSNKIYAGIIEAWETTYSGSFAPLISQELFESCQRVKSGNSGHTKPRSLNNPAFPLRGFVRCSECSQPLTGSSSTGRASRKYAYYHHHRVGCSKSVSIPRATLEQLFVEHLEAITPNPAFEELFKAIVLDVWKRNYQELDRQSQHVRKLIQKLESDRQEVFNLHRQKKYTDDEFLEQKNLINTQIESKQKQLSESVVDGLDMDAALDQCFDFVRNTSKLWLESDYQAKIQLQRTVFPKAIEFDGQKFGTAKMSLVYQLNQEYDGTKSSLAALVGNQWNQIIATLWSFVNITTAIESAPTK